MSSRGQPESDAGRLADFRFGAIAVWGGFVAPEAVDAALTEQRKRRPPGAPAPRLGEMLVERGFLTPGQVRRVLRVQLQRMPAEGHLLFGRIAAARRFATAEAVGRALDVQSREILAGGDVRRLGGILVAAGDILPPQVEAILAYQASRDTVPMSEARRGPATGAASPAEGGPAELPAPAGEAAPSARPGFLPSGAWGFVLDNAIMVVCVLAAAAAILVAVFRESVFG